MGSKSRPPPAPDYMGLAREQADASRANTSEQTWANRPNVRTPFGNQTWEAQQGIDPATGQRINQWTQNTTVSPELEGALRDQFRIQGSRSSIAGGMLDNLGSTLGQPVDFGDLSNVRQNPNTPGGYNLRETLGQMGFGGMPDTSGTRQRAEDALYQRQVRRLDPQFERAQSGLETQLANQGLARGSEAWNNAMTDQNNTREDAYSRAMLDSIAGGGVEAQREFDMTMRGRGQAVNELTQQANFDNQTFNQGLAGSEADMRQRQQMITEVLQRRGIPLNEINALLNGSQVGMPQMPSFQSAGRGETPQFMQAGQNQYGASLDGFNARNQQGAGIMGGLFGLGRAAIPFMF